MATPRALVSWSSGKDSAFALDAVRKSGEVEVVGLLTTLTAEYDRVSMHGVRRELLQAQAKALGLPLHVVEIPAPCPNETYERLMGDMVERVVAEGVEVVVFGDLFLEDIRAYRERMLENTGLRALFPLWGRDTSELARTMVNRGMRAHLTCVDPKQVSPALAGRLYDHDLLDALGPEVDPCGERGEFHSFVSDGPGFATPVDVRLGEIVEREGFVFADLLS